MNFPFISVDSMRPTLAKLSRNSHRKFRVVKKHVNADSETVLMVVVTWHALALNLVRLNAGIGILIVNAIVYPKCYLSDIFVREVKRF